MKKTSDDFLIYLVREGNQDAIDALYERYKYFIYGFINEKLKNEDLYYDYSELYQDLFLIFLRCIEKYDDYSGCFYTFVKTAVDRKIIDVIKKTKRYNKFASLDRMMFSSGNECCVDYVSEQDNTDTYLYDSLVENLNDIDKSIVDLKIYGYTYEEIAKVVGLGRQSVYRRFIKIRNILKDIIEKID